jgi:hypothetical protein
MKCEVDMSVESRVRLNLSAPESLYLFTTSACYNNRKNSNLHDTVNWNVRHLASEGRNAGELIK